MAVFLFSGLHMDLVWSSHVLLIWFRTQYDPLWSSWGSIVELETLCTDLRRGPFLEVDQDVLAEDFFSCSTFLRLGRSTSGLNTSGAFFLVELVFSSWKSGRHRLNLVDPEVDL